MLVHANAEISDGDSQGLTPLHIAVSRGHRESVLKLIELGADVNCASRNGFTPLHCAVDMSHADIVDDLIEWGAKVKTGQKANNLALVVRVWIPCSITPCNSLTQKFRQLRRTRMSRTKWHRQLLNEGRPHESAARQNCLQRQHDQSLQQIGPATFQSPILTLPL